MAETIASFIQRVCGTYTPITDATGQIPSGLAGVDFTYICTYLMLFLVVYSVFRIIGGLICRY